MTLFHNVNVGESAARHPTEPAPEYHVAAMASSGQLGRLLTRSAIAMVSLALLNSAIVFAFLQLTEAHGATLAIVGQQRALAIELIRLASLRVDGNTGVDEPLGEAMVAFETNLSTLRHGAGAGDETPPAPALVSDDVLLLESEWRVFRQELANSEAIGVARERAERLASISDDIVDTLRETRRRYRRALAIFAGVSSILLLGLAILGARYYQLAVLTPARLLQRLARRAVDRRATSEHETREDPTLQGAVEAVTDLSVRLEEVRTQRDLAQGDYRAIFDNALAGIYQIGFDGRVLLANAAFAEMLGYESGEVLQNAVRDAHREIFVDSAHRERFRTTSDDARLPVIETCVRRRDGEEIWVLESSRRFRNADVTGCEGIVFDITPRKRATLALRQLSGRLMELQDEERQRIARELHDSMGQILAAMQMNLTRLEDVETLPPSSSELLRDSLDLCAEASRQTRTLSHLLHPPLLEELGLAHALKEFAEGFEKRSGIAVELDVHTPSRLPPALQTAVFRFVQECLTNVHRHSGSEQARILVVHDGRTLRAECEDRGHGMPEGLYADGELTSVGVGLRGIQSRLEQFGGALEIDTSGEGTRVTAVVPTPD